MRKLITILTVAFALTLSGAAHAQKNAYLGVRSDDGAKVSIGVSVPVTGALQMLTYTDIGEYSSLSTEALVIGHFPNTPFYIGAIAGPNLELGDGATDNPTDYLVGASGLLVGYKGKSKIGAAAWAKYKFAFKDDVRYVNGVSFGGVITYGL